MKNKGKMRILALVLCMAVMLSNSSFIFASGETETAAAAPETTAVTPEPEVSAASELAELPTPEPTVEPTEAPTPEPTAEPTPEASAAPEPTEVPTPEVSAAPEPTAEPTPEASAAPEPTEVPTPEASASPTPAAEQDIGSEESAAVTPTPGEEPESDESSEEIVLEGSCGDMTVLLSGPASSFPEGTELSILVQEPAEEDQEVIEEAVEEREVVFVMDRFGYGKILEKHIYERNKEAVEEEYRTILPCMNTDKLCLFTQNGIMHQVKVQDIPGGRLREKGMPLWQILQEMEIRVYDAAG